MRIAMFSRILPIHSAGGMQDHVQTLSAGLVRKGHQVTVITTAHQDEKEFEIIDGVDVYFLKDAPMGRNTNAYWFRAARKFEELQAAQPFDILHSQSVGAYGVWKRGLNRKYNLPLVTSFHGTHLDVFTTSWHTDVAVTNPLGTARFLALSADLVYRYLARDLWFTRESDILIATSDADVGKYQKLYGAQVSRIRKVYNGIDTYLFAPARDISALRASLNLRDGEKIILSLARLQKDKGVQNAIVVMPRLLKQINARLIVVGDGDYRASLEALARAQGVADHVMFVGTKSITECADYFTLCDIFVDPTLRTDGYDLTIAEAMACGKPVIVSDVGANSTLIDAVTMRDGILIPRGDNDALTCQILRVLADPEMAQTMGELGRQKVSTRFSIEAMVDGMEKVYREQLRSKRAN